MPRFQYATEEERAAIVAVQEALGRTMLADDLVDGQRSMLFDLDNHVPAVKGPTIESRLVDLESEVADLRTRV